MVFLAVFDQLNLDACFKDVFLSFSFDFVSRFSTYDILLAISFESFGSQKIAAFLPTSVSEATFEQTTGVPQAILSKTGRPKPS